MLVNRHSIDLYSVQKCKCHQLPKLELCSYDADPLQYYPFITAFDETVDAIAKTGAAKLNHLVSYTTGAVKKAIQSGLIIGSDKGYFLTRRTLKE